MYISALVEEQPVLLSSNRKNKVIQDEDEEINFGSVRMPISVALLDALNALQSANIEKKEAMLVSERVKEILENYYKKLEAKPIPEDILLIFQSEEELRANPEEKTKLKLNWRGVILKLHQLVLQNKNSFEFLSDFVSQQSKQASKAEESELLEEDDQQEDDVSSTSEDEQKGPSIPNSAHSRGSMAWIPGSSVPGSIGSVHPLQGSGKGPQLLKSSPFIPIKAHKTKKTPLKSAERSVSTPLVSGPRSLRSSLNTSSENLPTFNINVEEFKGPSSIPSTAPVPGFEVKGASSVYDNLSAVPPNIPSIAARASKSFDEGIGIGGGIEIRKVDPTVTAPIVGTSPLVSNLSSGLPPAITPVLSNPSLPPAMPPTVSPLSLSQSGSMMSPSPLAADLITSPPSRMVTKTSNLPPTRLSQSITARVNIGQSFVYEKAPLIDPVKRAALQTPSTGSAAPLSTEIITAQQQPASDEQLPSFFSENETSVMTVYPTSYFRLKEKEVKEVFSLGDATIASENVTLPDWLDMVVYWGDRSNSNDRNGLKISLETILLGLNSSGHFDLLLASAISHELYTIISNKLQGRLFPAQLKDALQTFYDNYSPLFNEAKAAELLLKEYKYVKERSWNSERYNSMLQSLINVTSDKLEAILNDIEEDLLLHIRSRHRSLVNIERLLICLLGHDAANARQAAVRMLNMLYDGHDWQRSEALGPVIRYVGDSFVIELEIDKDFLTKNKVYALVYGPGMSFTKAGGTLSSYSPRLVDDNKLVVSLPSFDRAGYYDWRFVTVGADGDYIPLSQSGIKKLSKVQGRVIVHPAVKDEILHEVFVEVHDSEWDRRSDYLQKKGSFSSIAKSLLEYKNNYRATSLYVMGSLDRPRNSSPFAPTDKAIPNRWLGGSQDFDLMINAAKELDIKIIVDSTARLSAKAAHRKYRDLVCNILDPQTDYLKPHPGTDGRDFTWNDCVHLNFRKKATWDLMINEAKEWAERGVSGARLDAAHSWPLILRSNPHELFREDSDGQYHYSYQEIMDGEVVLSATDEGISFGYFGTEASATYPNPFFTKLTREIWKDFPTFIFLAEVYWNRETMALRSGLIPYATALPRALASVFDLGIHKDGSITYLPERTNVRVFYDWYQLERMNYPQNSILVYPSSTHYFPTPASIYGPGSWAAVDLLFFLPEIPQTFGPERKGWTVNIDITKNRFSYPDFDKNIQKMDFSAIRGHYEHRSMMRRTYPALREGGMIPLLAFWGGGWHDRVFAFARFTKRQMAIIAINFNDVDSVFYIDYSPLKDICEISSKLIYRIVDFINPTNPPQYYSAEEFLYEKKYVLLPPYGSLCWGVYVQADSPTSQRVLYEHSLARLQRILQSNLDPTNNMVYSIITHGLGSIKNFSESLKKISEQQGPAGELSLPPTLQYILYHATKGSTDLNIKALSYLNHLSTNSSDRFIQNLCSHILQNNIMGPIVFITPEIGRFSTVGGVGVMVNELTQALAALGCQIHIISPYYNFNRKGKTGYLEAEGIHWTFNLVTYVGNEYVEIGVHQGKEHGVNLHFLHNFTYFPTPYHTGSPVYQLSTIVLMAKASLELCCQLRLLPSIIVTNDWYTALAPAYAKRSGAFGTTFSGTTFFHLIHNLEEGYEGKIYIDGNDDLGSIHQLARELIVEYFPGGICLNASRASLLSCDQWGTVSKSYRDDLIRTSPLGPLLARFPHAFGKQNGIRLEERLQLLSKIAKDHDDAKAKLQTKYFGESDPSIPIFAFIGRIVLQKGVHLILNAVRELMDLTKGKIQILVGGMANMRDPYAAQCAWAMQGLHEQFPKNFWGDPNEFFVDGPLVNYGADFALMPSLFEPSGVVQQEFFAGGTPVIAFKTGGLKDSVFEFDAIKCTGNGFTFEAHSHGDFVYAIQRALNVFNSKETYLKCRQSAFNSVLDVEEVAIAWIGEYARLRQRVWAPPAKLDEMINVLEEQETNPTSPNEEKKE